MAFNDAVQLLQRTQVVAIITTRARGTAIATPIWAMVLDGVPYLRSAFGPGSWWYRHVLAGRPVSVAMGDGRLAIRDRDAALELPAEPVATTSVSADDPVQERIDAEILRKYAEAPQTSIDAMLSAEARGCTLRLEAPSV